MVKSRLQMVNEQYAPDDNIAPPPSQADIYDAQGMEQVGDIVRPKAGAVKPQAAVLPPPPQFNLSHGEQERHDMRTFTPWEASGRPLDSGSYTSMSDKLNNEISDKQAQAGNEQMHNAWMDLWNGITGSAGKVAGGVLDSPISPINRRTRDFIGEGMQASAENTAGGLGVIANADNEARRNQIEEARKDMPAYAESLRSKQVWKGGAPRSLSLSGSAGEMSTEKTSVIDRYMDDQRVRAQSENFRGHVADIARQTGQNPDDPRVIFEAARAQRGEQGGFADAIAEGLVDPTNLAFAPIGGGAATKALSGALNKGADVVAGHAGQVAEIVGETMGSPVHAAIDELKQGGRAASPAFGQAVPDRVGASRDAMVATARGELPKVYGMADIRPSTIGANEPDIMANLYEQYKNGKRFDVGSFRGGDRGPIPAQVEVKDRLESLGGQAAGETYSTTPPYIKIRSGMSFDDFASTMRHELEHAGQREPGTEGGMNTIDAERAAYGITGETPAEIAKMQSGEAKAKYRGKWEQMNLEGTTRSSSPEAQRQIFIDSMQPKGSKFPDAARGMSADTPEQKWLDANRRASEEQGAVDNEARLRGELTRQSEKDLKGHNVAEETMRDMTAKYGKRLPPGDSMDALGLRKPATIKLDAILENMRQSSNPMNRKIARDILKQRDMKVPDEDILRVLEEGQGAFGTPTPEMVQNSVQHQKDLARARSIAEKIVNDPRATEADRIQAQLEVAKLQGGKPMKGTGGAIAENPELEAKLKGRIPELTPEQIDEAKKPIPSSLPERDAARDAWTRERPDIMGDPMLNPEERQAIEEKIARGELPNGRQAIVDTTGRPMPSMPKEYEGKSDQEIVDALNNQFGKRPRADQTTFGATFGTGKGVQKPIGTNLPTEQAKSIGQKTPGTQAFVDRQAKGRINDIAGDLSNSGVGDVEQAMIDAGIRRHGTNPMRDMGDLGLRGISWAMRAPRELLVSADISMSLRQGGMALTSHPKEWAAAIKDELGALASEGGLDAAEAKIKAIPTYDFAQSMGLRNRIGKPGFGAGAGARFEGYTGAIKDLAEQTADVPVLGGITRGTQGVVRASERASEAFLASVRTRIFDTYANAWGLMDMESLAKMTPKQIEARTRDAKQLASFINQITGSGDLGFLEVGGKLGFGGGTSEALNKLFFSPRFFASRINNIFSPLVYGTQAIFGESSWRMAGLATRDLLQFYGITLGTLTAASQLPGVEVGMDPNKAGFGQIRVGDHVIDITGGMARTLGEIARLNDRSSREEEYGQSTGREELANFLYGKLNPPVSNLTDILSANRDISGAPRGVTGHIPVPLDLQNISQAALNDFNENGTSGLLSGAAIASLEVLGLGVQTYKKDRTKQPDVSQNPIDSGLSQLTGIGQPTPKKGRRVSF